MKDEKMTVKEVAEYADRHEVTIRKWLRKGWLPYTQDAMTRRITIRKSDVDRLLDDGPPQKKE